MRTYLILAEKAKRWNADAEIQGLLKAASAHEAPSLARYSASGRDTLLGHGFDRQALAAKGLAYEQLDQLTVEILLGVR